LFPTRATKFLTLFSALLLLAPPAMPDSVSIQKNDKTALRLRKMLALAFADLKADIHSDPLDACATVEKANDVFSPSMLEYMTHTGDQGFYRKIHHWYRVYCGREPDTPVPDKD
jgi:hypothetical protein